MTGAKRRLTKSDQKCRGQQKADGSASCEKGFGGVGGVEVANGNEEDNGVVASFNQAHEEASQEVVPLRFLGVGSHGLGESWLKARSMAARAWSMSSGV